MSADDYPGPNGETLRRQRLPGAAERWEALPWENRMSLLGALAEEAAQHRLESEFNITPTMRERYAALATTWETAREALMRADTVSSKDKSVAEYEAERAKYEPLADNDTIVRSLMTAAQKADDLAKRKRNAGLDVARYRAAGRAEGLMEAVRMLEDRQRRMK